MVEITTAPSVTETAEEILQSALFSGWVENLSRNNITPVNPHVQAVLQWGNPLEPKMIFLTTEAYADGRKIRRTAVFLRGKTVEILPIIECEGEEYVLLVKQLRIPGATYAVSTPAGMMDGQMAQYAGPRELSEETNLTLNWSEPRLLIDKPLLVTPGGSDEEVTYLYTKAKATRAQIANHQGHIGGLAAEGEQTQSLIVPIDEAPNRTNCVKTHHSLFVYQLRKLKDEI